LGGKSEEIKKSHWEDSVMTPGGGEVLSSMWVSASLLVCHYTHQLVLLTSSLLALSRSPSASRFSVPKTSLVCVCVLLPSPPSHLLLRKPGGPQLLQPLRLSVG